jgi:hypothetical protein
VETWIIGKAEDDVVSKSVGMMLLREENTKGKVLERFRGNEGIGKSGDFGLEAQL